MRGCIVPSTHSGCILRTNSFRPVAAMSPGAKMSPETSLSWMRISLLRSLSALPALMMNGTPSQRSLFT